LQFDGSVVTFRRNSFEPYQTNICLMEPQKPTNYSALFTLVGVFFFWGFIAASNGVFIPFCKSKFELSQFQSQLIDSAFYFAYYIGAFLLFIVSIGVKKDFLNSWGYRNGIVYGLMISVLGAFFMFPALASNQFSLILAALFIIGLGFSLQQTAAQPFAISLGDERTGSNRLNLAGGINSFGTTIGPIIFALALLGTTTLDESLIKGLSLSTIQWLYVFIGLAFLLAAGLFKFSKKLPDIRIDSTIENESKATWTISLITIVLIVVLAFIFHQNTGDDVDHHSPVALWLMIIGIVVLVGGLLSASYFSKKDETGWGAFKYPQLVLGMLAIFTYVGTEVTIQSNLGEYLKHLDFIEFFKINPDIDYKSFTAMLKNKEVDGFWAAMTPMLISLYWGSLMIGRWAGAISVFNLSSKGKKLALIVVPYVAFLVIIGSNMLAGVSSADIIHILPYAGVILIQIFGFWLGQDQPDKTLKIFGMLGIIAMVTGMYTTGNVSVFAFVSGGLFCSVMWPVIFSLALQGLGKFTSQGSAFLVMMILGGAILPPLQGKIADMVDISASYWVPVFGFAYLTLFAMIVRKVSRYESK
jgi:MFS transporter, FHS family, L-fucose permease